MSKNYRRRFQRRDDVLKKTFSRLGLTVTVYINGVTSSENFGEILGYNLRDKAKKMQIDCDDYTNIIMCFAHLTEDDKTFLELERTFSQWHKAALR